MRLVSEEQCSYQKRKERPSGEMSDGAEHMLEGERVTAATVVVQTI